MIKIVLYTLLALQGFPFQQETGSAHRAAKLSIKKIIVQDPACFNYSTGNATVVVQGGVPPYQFSLDGKYFQQEAVFKHLKAGNYRVYLKDAAGNLNTSTFTVDQPKKIHFSPAKTTNSGCCDPNGAVLVEAHGGTGAMMYQINDSKFQASGYFTGLAGGYTIVAMDSLGCKASLVVKVDDFNGPVIDFINSTEVSCPHGRDGTVTVYTVGGSGNIAYSVDGGKSWQPGPKFEALKAGTYGIKVKDATGCTDSASLVISQPPAIEANVTSTHEKTGEVNQVKVHYSIGGTGEHCYSLNGIDFQEATIFKTKENKETIYIKDMAGCTADVRLVNAVVSVKKTGK